MFKCTLDSYKSYIAIFSNFFIMKNTTECLVE